MECKLYIYKKIVVSKSQTFLIALSKLSDASNQMTKKHPFNLTQNVVCSNCELVEYLKPSESVQQACI